MDQQHPTNQDKVYKVSLYTCQSYYKLIKKCSISDTLCGCLAVCAVILYLELLLGLHKCIFTEFAVLGLEASLCFYILPELMLKPIPLDLLNMHSQELFCVSSFLLSLS